MGTSRASKNYSYNKMGKGKFSSTMGSAAKSMGKAMVEALKTPSRMYKGLDMMAEENNKLARKHTFKENLFGFKLSKEEKMMMKKK